MTNTTKIGIINEIKSIVAVAQATQAVIDAQLILLTAQIEHCHRNPDNEEMAHIMQSIEEDRQFVRHKQKKLGDYIGLIDYYQDQLKNFPIV
ncbi:hypothetical protein MKY15_21765 [Sporosarcina sp. FSL K6-1540]|uniref:hypothetical protein n=1 Tax=Sporosarcina sp. FSL K6-1540 TaxID=2921555 RepID=UPI00315AF190